MLTRVLRFRLVTLAVTILSLGASLYAFNVIPKGFFPSEDTGLILASTEAVQDISFQSMATHQQEVAAIVQSDPDVADVGSFIGSSPFNPGLNNGRMFITLKDRDLRVNKAPIGDVIQRLRRKVGQLPGVQTYFQAIQNINVGGTAWRAADCQYQFKTATRRSCSISRPSLSRNRQAVRHSGREFRPRTEKSRADHRRQSRPGFLDGHIGRSSTADPL